ncbi:GyrI-like domain-containing protein [Mobilicoccus pelagius]|uniref:AraC family transcriptional regulator n=1 Tax=Mobilicoccus pelagius NBRC 104925 TaxID=1089455 RepID=H5UPS8_9MICO|nr:GyrI-like domain-containing protein [Mobilicoccus pelagius]GAB47733.1 hypothetical protein MOPEL_029_00120 [Mobilicoccus pelagius NBRC 104925]
MDTHARDHALGRIDVVTLDDLSAVSRDVPLDLSAVQAAWPEFERGFDSLRGRRMMGLCFAGTGVYRMCATRLEGDANDSLGLDETTVPGGDYLRLRLRGEPPAIYERIGEAFDVLFDLADHDPTRPHIESYRREGEIDCLVPVVSNP